MRRWPTLSGKNHQITGRTLAKDAKMRELEKTLRERPEEIPAGQIESAQKEFHDVEQRFALVESPDLSDISLPSFSSVLVKLSARSWIRSST
ncbi:hypothetical protein R1flu_028052 [Riccia fluitans]|uniref:Uncharacterized protein n=1 Tax=Riccia fluitans TaxID=41844 RepID=A0ABD1XL21_9MARC